MKKIQNEAEYNVRLSQSYTLMKKGEKHLTKVELKRLESLANEIAEYEEMNYPFPVFTNSLDR